MPIPNSLLTITDLGAQGDGVGRDENGAIFVPLTLPGEQVRVEIRQGKDGIRRGRLLEIVKPSPDRAAPPCPHFGTCGGCRLQHMKADAYTAHKMRTLRDLLAKAGLCDVPLATPVITAPGTRRRARLAARHTKKEIRLGFNAWRSHELVNLAACPVLCPALETMVPRLREHLALWLPEGASGDIQLTALPDGIDVLLIGGPKLDVNVRLNLGELAETLGLAHLSWRKDDNSPAEPIAHRKPLPIRFGETTLPFPPGSFLQATETGEKALIAATRCAVDSAKKILDLYSGLGTFGLSMMAATQVHFADLDGPAMQALSLAARQNPRLTVTRRNLAKEPFSSGACNDYDAVIFDPPRAGAQAQAHELAQSRVPRIAALSCDPASFVRDAKILLGGGYVVTALQPVDQFLWSPHLELAATFARR